MVNAMARMLPHNALDEIQMYPHLNFGGIECY